MRDRHDLCVRIPVADGFQRVHIRFRAVLVEERSLVDEEHSHLDAGGSRLYLGKCEDDREGGFYLLTAGLRCVRQAGLSVFVDQYVEGRFLSVPALRYLVQYELDAHLPTGHASEDVVRRVRDVRDDVTDDLVRHAVLPECGLEDLISGSLLRYEFDASGDLLDFILELADVVQPLLDGSLCPVRPVDDLVVILDLSVARYDQRCR